MSKLSFPAFPMASASEFGRSLIGPGGPFELVTEDVLGEQMAVFKSRVGSLVDLFEQGSAQFPDNDYLADPERRLTYAQTHAAAAALAHTLRTEYGVQPGDRVAVSSANCLEWVVAFWAALATGAVLAAMNSFWTEPEVAAAIELTEPTVVLGDTKRLELIRRVDPALPSIEFTGDWLAGLLAAPREDLDVVPRDEDDPAVLIFTSGTTGKPKAVTHSHRGLVGYAQCNSFNATLRLGRMIVAPPQRVLVSPPLFHLSSLYGALIMQTVLGGLLVIRPGRFDEEATMRTIQDERVSLWLSLGSAAPESRSIPPSASTTCPA